MDDEQVRAYRRWQALEEDGRDEEADRAFHALFKGTVAPVPISHDFGAQTLAAVAAASERDGRRAQRARQAAVVAGVACGAAAIYFGAGYVSTGLSAAFLRLIDLMIVAVVSVASFMQSGADLWTVARSVGRAAAAMAGDARVAIALVVIQAVAVAAFVALRRLLDSDVELLK